MHHFSAVFSGGGTSTTSSGATTITTGGPKIVGVQRYGFHAMPTSLVIAFNSPLDKASAEKTRTNYFITGPGGSITVLSASYDPVLHTVTLKPATRLDLHARYTLVVIGAARRR